MKRKPVNFVKKGWGHELWLVNNDKYCGKILYFEKDKRLSWHYHLVKSETFYLQSGRLLVKFSMQDDLDKADEAVLEPGDCFDVPAGLRHQMIALEESYLFEFSTHHEDEDSIRILKGD